MAEAGFTINADVDKAPFVEATAGVYEMMGLTDVRARVHAADANLLAATGRTP